MAGDEKPVFRGILAAWTRGAPLFYLLLARDARLYVFRSRPRR
jgi:hypothetical protein